MWSESSLGVENSSRFSLIRHLRSASPVILKASTSARLLEKSPTLQGLDKLMSHARAQKFTCWRRATRQKFQRNAWSKSSWHVNYSKPPWASCRVSPHLRRNSFSIPEPSGPKNGAFKNAPKAARVTVNNAATAACFHYRV